MSRGHYVTGRRLESLRDRLTERQATVVGTVARVNVATTGQLRRLHYPDSEAGRRQARRDLVRLGEERFIARLGRRVGGVRAGSDATVWALDVAGQRLIYPNRDRYRTPWTPGAQHMRHALAVTELYCTLTEHRTTGTTVRFTAEPGCWRTFAGPGGAPVTLKPDAALVIETSAYEERCLIEVDLATEALTRITTKAKVYGRYYQSGREQAAHDVFPLVVWIAPDDPRAAAIHRALARLPATERHLHAVTTTAEATPALLKGDLITNNRRTHEPTTTTHPHCRH